MENKEYQEIEKEIIGETIEKNVELEKGEEDQIIITPISKGPLNMGKRNYILANDIRKTKPKTLFKSNSILHGDIGFKSKGFTQVATLSIIVAISGIIIAYLLFRY